MAHFLVRHLVEDLGRSGVSLTQALREGAIDAVALLLVGNREGEDLLLGEVSETLHRRILLDQQSETDATGRCLCLVALLRLTISASVMIVPMGSGRK